MSGSGKTPRKTPGSSGNSLRTTVAGHGGTAQADKTFGPAEEWNEGTSTNRAIDEGVHDDEASTVGVQEDAKEPGSEEEDQEENLEDRADMVQSPGAGRGHFSDSSDSEDSEYSAAEAKLAQLAAQRDERRAARRANKARGGTAAAAAGPSREVAVSEKTASDVHDLRAHVPVLKYKEADQTSELEEWLFAVKSTANFYGITAYVELERMARHSWDRELERWFSGLAKLREEEGRPICTWEDFEETLRSNFLWEEAWQAYEALLELKQGGNETMSAYLFRVDELYATAGQRAATTQGAIVVTLVRGVDGARFPETQRDARRAIQVAAARGRAISLVEMRSQLALDSLDEREAQRITTSAGMEGAGTIRQERKMRIAALRLELEEMEAEEEAENLNMHAAPVGAKEDQPPCSKCRKRGHFARMCTAKTDKRVCRGCGRKGHLIRDCRNKDDGGD